MKPTISFMAVLLATVANAETYKMSSDVVKAKISASHLNRISVKNDEILSVSGIAGTYFFEKNEKLGIGHIKPAQENGNNPISLNITTISGKTQDLLLEVKDGDPQTIELEGKDSTFTDNTISDLVETASDYEASAVEAMKLLISGNLREIDANAAERKANNFKLELLGAYRVSGFIGYKYRVSTDIKETIELHERRFAKSGDAAISLSCLYASKTKPTILYVLRKQ